MDWFRACSEREILRSPRKRIRRERIGYDYSSVIVAKDNTYGEKYDVKFTDVNGKKTHFQMGDVLGEILPEEERRATRTHGRRAGRNMDVVEVFVRGNRWARKQCG